MIGNQTSPFHLFGIRHHGPGSARSLLHALEQLAPDCIVIEGPPEAEDLLSLIGDDMQPPVALLGYVPKQPSRAIYFPFAEFSPEWQALRYAKRQNIPVRFMDLPWENELALLEPESTEPALSTPDVDEEDLHPDPSASSPTSESQIAQDPLSALAKAAGYDDTERFWEHWVEQRRDSVDLFSSVQEAMCALREQQNSDDPQQTRNALREAFMRTVLREAKQAEFKKIAVVCGAWHVPALLPETWPSAKDDRTLLQPLPKTPVALTWIPWTYGRLAAGSGYRAGVESPGWYDFLWHQLPRATTAPSIISEGWLTRVARLLRDRGLDASAAQTVDAVRLADTLAALRGRPLPGLPELNDACLAIFCQGNPLPMQLIHTQLLIHDRLGQVPADTPGIPLYKDIVQQMKTLRLDPVVESTECILDLRKDLDLQRSRFLHCLSVLGIPFGQIQSVRSQGTFKEGWLLLWKPEFVLSIVERACFGTTLEEALRGFLRDQAKQATSIDPLAQLLPSLVFCDVPGAIDPILQRIQDLSALNQDLVAWAKAIPPFVQLARYGDVRNTTLDNIQPILDGIVSRLAIQLPAACNALNDEAAQDLLTHLVPVHTALVTLQNQTYLQHWLAALNTIASTSAAHGLLAGRAARWLFEQGADAPDRLAQRLHFALSSAAEPAQAAAWIEGLLHGGAHLLIHDEPLWSVLHRWIQELSPEHFLQVLPLLRRTTATFSTAESRQLLQRVRQPTAPVQSAGNVATSDPNAPLLQNVLHTWARVVGVPLPPPASQEAP